jgi:site-specific DNA recombinase
VPPRLQHKIVYNPSCNISDFCDLYKELGKYKANFLSIKEQFDTSTPIGEMMVFNMVNLAQFERKQTSERISMNFHSRAMRGLVNGYTAPKIRVEK